MRIRHLTKRRIMVAIAITVVSVVLLGVVLHGSTSIPHYQFLRDKHLVLAVHKDRSFSHLRKYTYSFPGDFNTVCSMASNELLPMGFLADATDERHCWFSLLGAEPMRSKRVLIIRDHKATLHKMPGRTKYESRQGWSSVEVFHSRPKPRLLRFITRMRIELQHREQSRAAVQKRVE